MFFFQNERISDDDDDDDDDIDDDTQSTNYLQTSDENVQSESLNSSHSSLQQPTPAVFKNLVVARQSSTSPQIVQNPIYSGPKSNLNRRFSNDLNSPPPPPPPTSNETKTHVRKKNFIDFLLKQKEIFNLV